MRWILAVAGLSVVAAWFFRCRHTTFVPERDADGQWFDRCSACARRRPSQRLPVAPRFTITTDTGYDASKLVASRERSEQLEQQKHRAEVRRAEPTPAPGAIVNIRSRR